MKALAHLNKYLFQYKWRLLLGVLFIICSNVLKVYTPKIIGNSFDLIKQGLQESENGVASATYKEELIQQALEYAGIFLLITITSGFFLFLTRQTIIVVSRYIEYDLKNEIFRHYQRLSTAFYKRHNTGDLMNRISEDVTKVRMYLGPGIMYTINLTVLFVLGLIAMLNVNPELTLFALMPLPILSLAIYYVSSIINRKSEIVQRQQSKLSTFVQEAVSGIRVLKAYNREIASRNDFDDENEDYKDKSLKLVKVEALFFPIIILLIGLSNIITIYFGSLKAMDPTSGVTVGDMAQFVIYINMMTWPFASLGWVTSLIQRAEASQKRINEFLNEAPEIVNHNEEESTIEGRIAFEEVSFVYPDSGIEALRNVSFEVLQGETLAIIGRTGSGKSTIANLVCRHYDATNGNITIDNKNIQAVNLNALRSAIGYVPQDVFLFSDTIFNNIAFGLKAEEANIEMVEAAAKNAAIYHNIIEFNDRFDTILGERGITLSGGQKQRVSIARAIIKNPQILIFDDCLSAVDTATEEQILQNLEQLMKGKTSIIISHRVSSVKGADKIIVLDEGRIIEDGNHDSLLQKKGAYYELYQKQLLEEEKINQ